MFDNSLTDFTVITAVIAIAITLVCSTINTILHATTTKKGRY